jgi:hypothetical protein
MLFKETQRCGTLDVNPDLYPQRILTKLSTCAKFALKGTLLCEVIHISGAFFIITARNYD